MARIKIESTYLEFADDEAHTRLPSATVVVSDSMVSGYVKLHTEDRGQTTIVRLPIDKLEEALQEVRKCHANRKERALRILPAKL